MAFIISKTHQASSGLFSPAVFAKLRRPRWSPTTKSSSGSLRTDKLLHVFAEQVCLEVHGISNRALAQRGVFIRVRNDPDAKTFFAHTGDGEADSVHGDGSFEDNVTHHFRRRGDVEHVILAGAFPPPNLSDAVNVAGDEMASEFGIGAERTFQVHERAGPGELQVGAPPRFLE